MCAFALSIVVYNYIVRVTTEHEMEDKLQSHQQEMQKLTQNWQIEKERSVYQTNLKLEAEEVSMSHDVM